MINIQSNVYNGPEYDDCGNDAVAILQIGTVMVPICDTCIDELIKSLTEFKQITFCYKCKNFIKNPSGFNYSGSCRKRADECKDTISDNDIGYRYCTDSMSTCKDAIPINKG